MAKKTKYRKHLDAICRSLTCVRDAHEDDDFLNDIENLRKIYRKLYKVQREMWMYPSAPPKRYNEMREEITNCRKIIIDICKERDIGYQFYSIKDFEFKKLDMPLKLMRKGYVMNAVLDF